MKVFLELKFASETLEKRENDAILNVEDLQALQALHKIG